MGHSLVETVTERSRFLAALALAVAATAMTYGSLIDHGDATFFLVVVGTTTVLALVIGVISLLW